MSTSCDAIGVFRQRPRLVPGSAALADLWVRNNAADTARLAVRFGGIARGDPGQTRLLVAVDGQPKNAPAPFAAHLGTLVSTTVPAGASILLTVTIGMPVTATRGPHNLSFSLLVTLGQDVTTVPAGPAGLPVASEHGTADHNGVLPDTGVAVMAPIRAAIVALAAGLLLLALGRWRGPPRRAGGRAASRIRPRKAPYDRL